MATTTLVINLTYPDTMAVNANNMIANQFGEIVGDINFLGNTAHNGWQAEMITGTDLRERALRSAIEVTLSSFPEDWTDQQIVDGITQENIDDETIIPWGNMAHMSTNELADHINGLADVIVNAFKK